MKEDDKQQKKFKQIRKKRKRVELESRGKRRRYEKQQLVQKLKNRKTKKGMGLKRKGTN